MAREKPTLEPTEFKLVVITAIMEVHPRHSQGWIKDEVHNQLISFAPVKHISVEEYQDRENY